MGVAPTLPQPLPAATVVCNSSTGIVARIPIKDRPVERVAVLREGQ